MPALDFDASYQALLLLRLLVCVVVERGAWMQERERHQKVHLVPFLPVSLVSMGHVLTLEAFLIITK
jgi:hypothetical protein